MIKLVILVDVLRTLEAGSERQILELCKNIDKDKYKVSVFCLKGDESVLNKLRDLNIEASCLNVKRIYGISGLISGINFFKYLKKEKIDVLMTYHFGSDIWGTYIAHLSGVKYIISNRRDMGFWRSRRHINAYKMFDRYVHKIIVNTRAIKELFIQEEGIEEKKIEVISNGVDTHDPKTYDEYSKQRFGMKNDDLVIMHVANLTPVKSHKYLLEAMALVIPECQKAKLVLIGDGPLREQITNSIRDLGLEDHVSLLGRREDVRQLLTMADICVLTSSSEGMSNAILEYMAAGKPIIATDIVGNNEVIENERNGLLVKPADPLALANKLMYLIENSDVCDRIGKAAYDDVIRKYSIQQLVDVYEQTIENLVAGKL